MKKNLVLLIAISLVSACSKKEDKANQNPPPAQDTTKQETASGAAKPDEGKVPQQAKSNLLVNIGEMPLLYSDKGVAKRFDDPYSKDDLKKDITNVRQPSMSITDTGNNAVVDLHSKVASLRNIIAHWEMRNEEVRSSLFACAGFYNLDMMPLRMLCLSALSKYSDFKDGENYIREVVKYALDLSKPENNMFVRSAVYLILKNNPQLLNDPIVGMAVKDVIENILNQKKRSMIHPFDQTIFDAISGSNKILIPSLKLALFHPNTNAIRVAKALIRVGESAYVYSSIKALLAQNTKRAYQLEFFCNLAKDRSFDGIASLKEDLTLASQKIDNCLTDKVKCDNSREDIFFQLYCPLTNGNAYSEILKLYQIAVY